MRTIVFFADSIASSAGTDHSVGGIAFFQLKDGIVSRKETID